MRLDRPLTLTRRNHRIEALIAELANDDVGFLDQNPARIVYPRMAPRPEGTCVVGGCPLVGTQELLCWGHWDYLIVTGIDGEAPFRQMTAALHDWLVAHARGLRVVHSRVYYVAINHARLPCEYCGTQSRWIESIVNDAGERIRSHLSCEDHLFYRQY